MKIKNKGKVYPSPSSSSSSSSSSSARDNRDGGDEYLSVLKLLPATILTLASVLSLQDREVLAYMITRSLKTTTSTSNNPSFVQDSKKKSKNKLLPNTSTSNTHKAPLFDCDCFDCYTSYWFRWDSSPNRELIHQAIEAFEEHLSNGELLNKNGKGKRRDKTGRRVVDKSVVNVLGRSQVQEPKTAHDVVVSPHDEVSPVAIPERAAGGEEEMKGREEVGQLVIAVAAEEKTEEMEMTMTPPAAAAVNSHKGLARKVLPDVLGLFNSRLWHLWSPNV